MLSIEIFSIVSTTHIYIYIYILCIYMCRAYVLPYILHSNFTNSTKIASGHVGVIHSTSIAIDGTVLHSPVADPGGVRRFRPNPPFWLVMLGINLICTVKDPGFMEPPFLPFS